MTDPFEMLRGELVRLTAGGAAFSRARSASAVRAAVQLERAAGAAELLAPLGVRERPPVIVAAVQPCAGGATCRLSARQSSLGCLELDDRCKRLGLDLDWFGLSFRHAGDDRLITTPLCSVRSVVLDTSSRTRV
jgi:hypothetical protein